LLRAGSAPTPEQTDTFKQFILKAEEIGLDKAVARDESQVVRYTVEDLINSHVTAFEITFVVTAAIALVGAAVCLVLVRKSDRVADGPGLRLPFPLGSERTRESPAITRHPPPEPPGPERPADAG
jgi:hypothetical protein